MGPSVTGGTMVVAGMIQLHTLYPAVKRRKNDMTGQAPLRRPPCFMTGSLTFAVVLAACVLMTAAMAQDSLPDYSAIIASPDRTDADLQTDKRRDPVKLLAFTARWHHLYCTTVWRRRTKHQLRSQPLCEMCLKDGRINAATIADHIEPHKGDQQKFFFGELQSLC